jgi:hypothetical protein
MALVKLRARLRTEGTRQITQSDRRTNEQAIAVAKGEDQLPPFIAAGTFRWQEIRRAYQQAAAALDATGQADDRELAKMPASPKRPRYECHARSFCGAVCP